MVNDDIMKMNICRIVIVDMKIICWNITVYECDTAKEIFIQPCDNAILIDFFMNFFPTIENANELQLKHWLCIYWNILFSILQ